MNFWRITTYNGRGHQWSNTFNEKVPSMGDNQKKFSKAGHPVICLDFIICHRLRSNVNKKNSIFKNIVQRGGKEVNPILKNWKEMIFSQKLEREGVTKHIVKNRSTLYCMIYYSIWPNQGTLCLSVCTPDPQKVIRIIENVNSKPIMSRFLSKILGEGGRSTWSTLCQK